MYIFIQYGTYVWCASKLADSWKAVPRSFLTGIRKPSSCNQRCANRADRRIPLACFEIAASRVLVLVFSISTLSFRSWYDHPDLWSIAHFFFVVRFFITIFFCCCLERETRPFVFAPHFPAPNSTLVVPTGTLINVRLPTYHTSFLVMIVLHQDVQVIIVAIMWTFDMEMCQFVICQISLGMPTKDFLFLRLLILPTKKIK